jgi:hypothetical protein
MSTDEDIFASAMSETPAPAEAEQTVNTPAEATEAPTEAKSDRARDEQGRFVPKAPEASEPVVQETAPQPEVETPAPEGKPDVHVPSWRLAEEAQRRREAEQQLAEMRAEMRQIQQMQLAQQRQQTPQPQQEPVDPFADPQGFAQSIQQGFEGRLKELQLQHSLQFARFAHKETFDQAYEEFVDYAHRTRDQATYHRVMNASDPGEALVTWYKDQQLHKELGGSDLNSFLAKQREEWLKDPAVQAQVIEAFKATQQSQPSNITNLPPSLSRATSAAPSHSENGDWSQESIFKHAMKR